jgi:hypothetical protein
MLMPYRRVLVLESAPVGSITADQHDRQRQIIKIEVMKQKVLCPHGRLSCSREPTPFSLFRKLSSRDANQARAIAYEAALAVIG